MICRGTAASWSTSTAGPPGLDYDLSQYLGTYVRYNYYDWNDDSAQSYNSGTSHMVLGGVSGTF